VSILTFSKSVSEKEEEKTMTTTTTTTAIDHTSFLDTFTANIKGIQDELITGTFNPNTTSNDDDEVLCIPKNLSIQTRKADSHKRKLRLHNESLPSQYSTIILEGFMTAIVCHLVITYGIDSNNNDNNNDDNSTNESKVQNVISIISSSIADTFSLLKETEPSVNHTDASMMDLLLLSIFYDSDYDLSVYFTSFDKSKTCQQQSIPYSNGKNDSSTSNIFSLCSTLQQQSSISLQNYHNKQSRHKRQRTSDVADDMTTTTNMYYETPSTKEQLWKIPFVYCLSKVIYDLEVHKYQYDTSATADLLTVDDFITKVGSVTRLFPILNHSGYEQAGISFFLMDCLQALDKSAIDRQETILFSDLTLHRVTDELCKKQ
jgi:hypothetical protein